jgi:hypothetical protein
MNAADFNELSEAEKKHFYKCQQCEKWSICANWMMFSFTKITSRGPIFSTAARNGSENRVYEVRPRKDKRGVDLISDALPFGRLWYDGPNAVSHTIDCAGFSGQQCCTTGH